MRIRVPQITIESETYERLQRHAKPFVDTPDTVINLALDALDQLSGRPAASNGTAAEPERPIDPRLLPSLTHTKVLDASIGGELIPKANWNLLLDDRPSKTFEIQTFTQLHTVQYGLGQPFQAQQLTNVQLTQALKRAFLQGNYQFFNASLLPPFAPNINAGAINAFFPYHPSNASLGISTSDEQFGKLPFFERMRFGFGFQHNSYGLQTIGGVPYTTIWSHYAGFTIYSNPIRIGDPMKRFTDLYLNAILDKQRTWNSTPHYIDTTSTTFSLSKTFSQHLSSYLMYNVSNTGDFYTNGLQSVAYAPFVPTLNGISYPGYAAFHGQATLRTLSLGATYTNLDYFTFSLLARQHKDFPEPIPFLFPLPPTNVLGQFLYPNFLGQPAFDITGDLRFRLNPHMSIDISRSYYFNYENLRWTPQFVFQVMQ
jgi:hypothetical protein